MENKEIRVPLLRLFLCSHTIAQRGKNCPVAVRINQTRFLLRPRGIVDSRGKMRSTVRERKRCRSTAFLRAFLADVTRRRVIFFRAHLFSLLPRARPNAARLFRQFHSLLSTRDASRTHKRKKGAVTARCASNDEWPACTFPLLRLTAHTHSRKTLVR